MSDKVKAVAVAIAVVVLAVWVYLVYHKHAARDAAVAAVTDAAGRLRTALTPAPGTTPDFQRDAEAVHAKLEGLRKRDMAAVQPLADAADDYLVTAREILRRESAIHGAADRLGKQLDALEQHIRTDRGRADWTQSAIKLRAEVDREARDYRIATESYVTILESLPKSQERVARYVDPALLMDAAAVKRARERALDALARTEENVSRIAKLGRRG